MLTDDLIGRYLCNDRAEIDADRPPVLLREGLAQIGPQVADHIEEQLAGTLPIAAVIKQAWLYAPNGSH